MRPSTVLVTGIGGFVGHHVLEHVLAETDWDIVGIDSFRHRGKTSRVREVLASGPGEWANRTTILQHDLTVPIDDQLDWSIGPVDYVFNIASESHVDRSITSPAPFIHNNVAIMTTMLDWMRGRNSARPSPHVSHFIQMSTDEVYGPAKRGHDHVEGEPHRSSNPYSASKSAQESIAYSYWRTYDLPITISNTMNIIGERQDPEKFVPMVIKKVLNGDAVDIHAKPKHLNADPATPSQWMPGSRHYLHARNLADAYVFLAGKTPAAYSQGADDIGRYNIVGELEVDNFDLAKMIAYMAVDREFNYQFVDFHSSRPGHDLRYSLDGTKLASIGWTPPVPFGRSLERTVEWTLDHPHWLK